MPHVSTGLNRLNIGPDIPQNDLILEIKFEVKAQMCARSRWVHTTGWDQSCLPV